MKKIIIITQKTEILTFHVQNKKKKNAHQLLIKKNKGNNYLFSKCKYLDILCNNNNIYV